MPVAPSLLKSIKAVRKAMTSPNPKDRHQLELSLALHKLFRKSGKVAANLESIEALLALAPEIEAFRGKGSQMAANDFSRGISYLVTLVKERLPLSVSEPDRFIREDEVPPSAKEVTDCLERLADHAFGRTQGAPVRSIHAGDLRCSAWETLRRISEIFRRPAHLTHALKVAADPRASSHERQGSIGFLVAYWGDDEPDEPTADLLWELEKNPPDRTFLVTVLQAQIDLGLGSELGALDAVGDWDAAHDG